MRDQPLPAGRARFYYPTVKPFFVLLGALLSLYVVTCVTRGSVVVSWGPGARTFRRDDHPRWFWASVGIYALLALALIVVF